MPSIIRLLGLAILPLYLLGWLAALIGLALNQNWCQDNESRIIQQQEEEYFMLSNQIGDNCDQRYRFMWFIWVLSTLPVIFYIGHLVIPKIFKRGSSALYAAITPLLILATYSWHLLVRGNLVSSEQDLEKRTKLTLAGFAIMSGAALMMIAFESFMSPDGDNKHKKEVHHTEYKQHEHHDIEHGKTHVNRTAQPTTADRANLRTVAVVEPEPVATTHVVGSGGHAVSAPGTHHNVPGNDGVRYK